jgi:hypothetical protein
MSKIVVFILLVAFMCPASAFAMGTTEIEVSDTEAWIIGGAVITGIVVLTILHLRNQEKAEQEEAELKELKNHMNGSEAKVFSW